jgi:hypothetical protein
MIGNLAERRASVLRSSERERAHLMAHLCERKVTTCRGIGLIGIAAGWAGLAVDGTCVFLIFETFCS